MLYYFAGENASQHGGVGYLVTIAFQKGPCYSRDKLATEEETFWHFLCFVRYISSHDRETEVKAVLHHEQSC